ncbi:MAG TPA: hypothetical protein PKA29_00610 [Candidatus Saccharibacteria bacterium]|jgi:hypothetical protein|nr:hypothetical protein [Candidatus Saccharibacteria bacterium]
MFISKLKDVRNWGWAASLIVSITEMGLVYTHIANQSSILGIIDIQGKASYIYEGSYYWLSLVPISTLLFYWAFIKFVYARITTLKKIRPYTVGIAVIFMFMSLGLTYLMVFSS